MRKLHYNGKKLKEYVLATLFRSCVDLDILLDCSKLYLILQMRIIKLLLVDLYEDEDLIK